MHVKLKTRITAIVALLVLAVVAFNSGLYVRTLTNQVIQQAETRANSVVQRIYFQVSNALTDAANRGEKPSSNTEGALRDYVARVLAEDSALHTQIEAEVGDPLLYEVTVVDREGTALVSSDPSLPGRKAPSRPPLSEFVNAGFLQQLRIIYGPHQPYDDSYKFKLGPPGGEMPFGEIRVAADTSLLRSEIDPALRSAGLLALVSVLISVVLAAVVSNLSLAPLGRISAQLDRISRGEFDQKPLQRADEFGQVSTKISQIGQQLRGVREIFSTLRENLDQILGGLEDGLLLFTRDGRAVMVSPAVEHFLGQPASQFLGRKASEIFAPGSPLRAALGLADDEFRPAAAAEVELAGPTPDSPPRRIGAAVQVISEGGTRMGALVTLRDLESIERISNQLQVSERLAALGRVTAGVAHEVKNPLNSMRLWLENLKETLPRGEELPRQAVAVLDSEIDRLDSVVKRFLDFMRTPELHLEECQINEMLEEVAGIARPQMERAGVQVKTHFADLPPVRVDRDLLKQALLNLVFNAIEAMPSGGRLLLETERRTEFAEIRIQDTGRGIAPEHRGRIFQLFFTTRTGGSGIGLASAYKTVQLHDGEIDFESESGKGTTFRIELPLARAMETGFANARESARTMAGNP